MNNTAFDFLDMLLRALKMQTGLHLVHFKDLECKVSYKNDLKFEMN
jgi:hypothetical protein